MKNTYSCVLGCCVSHKMEEEEEEALRNYCSTMIVRVRNKQPKTESSDVRKRRRREHKGGTGEGRETTEPERHVVAGDELRDQRGRNLPVRDDRRPLRVSCQGPEVQPVPLQLVAMLRLKTFKEDMRRAADVELHDPSACSICVREKASLALRSFIRRKETQLQFQALKGRLNTRLIYGVSDFEDGAY